MRRTQWRQNATLWAAQALVTVLRTAFRIREVTLPEHKRTRLRELRLKLEAMDQDGDILMKRLKTEPGWDTFDALDEFEDRYSDSRTSASRQTHKERMRQIRQESETLQAIRKDAGENSALSVAGYQEYVKDHPESRSGWSYLGGALKKTGDLEASLDAYREAVRLSSDSLVAVVSNRVNIADVLHAKGEKEAAIAELRDLTEGAGTRSKTGICIAWNQLGDYLLEAGDRKAARQAWQQAVKYDATPKRPVAEKARAKLIANR